MENDISLKINSILLGLYLSINMLTKIVTSIYDFENNIPLIVILIFIFSLLNNRFKLNIVYIFFNFFIILLFAISMFRINDYTYTIYYLVNYVLYGMVATYLISFEIDFKAVVLTVNYIFLIFTLLLVIIYIPKIKTSMNLDFTMDLSYTSLIGISSVVLSFKHFNKKKLIFYLQLVSLIINIYFVLFISNNRGAILALLFLVFIMVISKIKHIISKLMFIIISFISLFLCIYNLENILLKMQNIFVENFNLRINWLERFLYQIAINDVSTGRDVLYRKAYNMFIDKPIFGNGIGYYELFNNGGYPHNIFLQMFCEHGLIISLIFIFLIILGLISIINGDNDNNGEFLKLFFILSIPRLMISSSYWLLHFFWLYLYVCIIVFNNKLLRCKQSRYHNN